MLSARTLTGVAVLLSVVACHRVSLTEKEIVGTWEFAGIDATGRMIFRPDHTVEQMFPHEDNSHEWYTFTRGKWWLEGNTIVADQAFVMEPTDGATPFPREVTRMAVRESHPDKLVFEKGSPFTRVK